MDDRQNICPLCARPLGKRRERHHVVPRLKGGRETVLLHPICHRKIHSLFGEAELARHGGSLEPAKQHEEIQRFIKWLANKHPDFYKTTRTKRR